KLCPQLPEFHPRLWVPRGRRRQVIPGIKTVLPEADAPLSACRSRPQPENAPSPMAADGNYPALVRSVRNPNSFFSRLKSLSSYSFVSLNLSLEFDTGERNQLMKKQKTSSSKALHMMEEEDFHDYGNDFHEGSRDEFLFG
ncbi:hypothetical protein MUK42_25162, partial [Musa troglodytarum]